MPNDKKKKKKSLKQSRTHLETVVFQALPSPQATSSCQVTRQHLARNSKEHDHYWHSLGCPATGHGIKKRYLRPVSGRERRAVFFKVFKLLIPLKLKDKTSNLVCGVKYVCCRTRRKPWSLKQELLWAEWISLCQLMNWQRGCQSQDWLPTLLAIPAWCCKQILQLGLVLIFSVVRHALSIELHVQGTQIQDLLPSDVFTFCGCTLHHSLFAWGGREDR